MIKWLLTILGVTGALLIYGGMNVYSAVLVISCDGLNRNMSGQGQKLTIIDVRDKSSFLTAHIPNAINVPYEGIEAAGLPKDSGLVLYCSNSQCPVSKVAAKTLENAGYKQLWVLDGGIEEWIQENFPVQTPAGVVVKDGEMRIENIAPGKLRDQLQEGSLKIIDTRAAQEYAAAHLPGAKSIPADGIESSFADLSKAATWVVYDKDLAVAVAVARKLNTNGYKVMVLSGGIQVWATKKYPLETGTAK